MDNPETQATLGNKTQN